MDYIAPTLDEIEELARETVANLPAAFRGDAEKVAIRVADFATDEILEEMEMDLAEPPRPPGPPEAQGSEGS